MSTKRKQLNGFAKAKQSLAHIAKARCVTQRFLNALCVTKKSYTETHREPQSYTEDLYIFLCKFCEPSPFGGIEGGLRSLRLCGKKYFSEWTQSTNKNFEYYG